jgi:L-arabinokinase
MLLASNCFNVHIVTQVKEDFFKQNLDTVLYSERVSHYLRSLDTGAVQRDVFVIDAVETLVKYHDNIHQHRQQLIDFELKWLRDANIKLVMVDATPLGCLVGSLVGAVTILVSNFSWDFCFKQMLQKLKSANVFTTEQVQIYNNMVSCCELDSSACSFYLQLPGATPLPACFDSSRLVAGPMIARGLRNLDLRALLSIDDSAKILLLGFGGHSAEWRLEDAFLPPGWVCLVLGGYCMVLRILSKSAT